LLLPFMEGNTIFQNFDLKKPLIDPRNLPAPLGVNTTSVMTPVPTYLCPSAPESRSDYSEYFAPLGLPSGMSFILPRTDYAAIRGLHSTLASCVGLPAMTTHNSMLGANDSPGVVGSNVNDNVEIVVNPKRKFASVTDGLSNTLCFIEIAGRQRLYFNGIAYQGTWTTTPVPAFTLNSSYVDWNTARHPRGLAGIDRNNPQAAGCAVMNVFNQDNPYSFHGSGVQALRGDGSVVFLPATISTNVFAALVTRDGGEIATLDE